MGVDPGGVGGSGNECDQNTVNEILKELHFIYIY